MVRGRKLPIESSIKITEFIGVYNSNNGRLVEATDPNCKNIIFIISIHTYVDTSSINGPTTSSINGPTQVSHGNCMIATDGELYWSMVRASNQIYLHYSMPYVKPPSINDVQECISKIAR